MKYIMVDSNNRQEFVKACNGVLRAGGKALGGVSVCRGSPEHPLWMTYCQAFLVPFEIDEKKLTEAINS